MSMSKPDNTDRNARILELARQGKGQAEIARELGMSRGVITTPGGTTGTVGEAVFSGDSNNPLGGLDFVCVVLNGGPNTLTSLSGLNYIGFATDVTQTGVSSNVPATSASRTGSGDEVTWNFTSNGQGTLGPGDVSDDLIVRTDATTFVGTGTITITDADGGTATVTGFAPTPEPSSLVLLGGCLAGLGGVGV